MSEITLQEYETEIDTLIEEARYLEAFAHTRHILSQHPRYINAYYLLGDIMLEADLPELAIDMFRRTLTGDPEHRMARIGLGLAYQHLNNLNAAIWNLERAYELKPSDPEVVDELRRLYGRRDGLEPDYIPLTRAGLARLYIQGNRTGRAVEELRKLLHEEPGRVDLQLALAQAYWKDDQIVQASDTCQNILDTMRYCLKANLLLGKLWLDGGQEEGQVYLDRAQEIDLTNTVAEELLGADSPLSIRDVTLQRLIYKPETASAYQQAEWFKHLTAASASVGISEAEPEMSPTEVRLVNITAGLESQIEIPDWLRELSGSEGQAEEGLGWLSGFGTDQLVERAETMAAVPEWQPEEATPGLIGVEEPSLVSTEAIAEDIPDWLKGAQVTEVEAAEEAPATIEEVPAWLSGFDTEESAQPAPAEEVPDWLNALKPTEAPQAVELPKEGVPDWLRELHPSGAAETPAPAADLPDWLRAVQPAAETESEEETPEVVEGELPEAEMPTEEVPDWLTGFVPESTEKEDEAEEAEEVPDWLLAFKPQETAAAEAVPARTQQPETKEEAAAFDWASLGAETAETAEAEEEAPFDWTSLGVETTQTTEAEEEVPFDWTSLGGETTKTTEAEEEAPFDWASLGVETTETAEAPEEAGISPSYAPEELFAEISEESTPTEESDLMSGDDALAWLQSLSAGKEEELRAQAAVESQARVDEILGRKPAAKVEPAPIAELPIEKVAPPPAPVAPVAEAEDFFGWDAFSGEVSEVGAATAPVEAGEPGGIDWESLGGAIDEGVVEEAPAPESDLMSGDDALAWLQSLSAGKEEELRAQAAVESQARVDEILGRKPAAKPAPVAEPPVEQVTPPAPVAPVAEAEDFFGWDAFSGEVSEVGAAAAPVAAGESGGIDWESLGGAIDEGVAVEEAPAPEGDLMSGDDALAWLQSLSAGKEEELRAQAAVESQARVDEILGRKPAAKPTPVPEPPVEKVTPPAPKPEPVAPPKPEPKAVAPAPESDLMSGDDALAWLQSLSAGKEEELRAQAAVESQARVDEILGRKPAAKVEPVAEPPVEKVAPPPAPVAPVAEAEDFFGWDTFSGEVSEVGAATAPVEAGEPGSIDWESLGGAIDEGAAVEEAPAPEGDLMSGDDALAWLQSLSAGKEEELRAQAAVESQARVDEILGRKSAAKPAPVPEPPVEKVTPPAPKPEPVAPPKPEPAPVAPASESDLMSGDDALAWLQSLSAGKEEELRAQAAVESQARVDEILGRKPAAKPAPVAEPPVEKVAPPAPVAPVAEAEDFFGWDAFSGEVSEVGAATAPVEAVESSGIDWESLGGAIDEGVAVEEAPAPESDLMSGDDALAWLQSLSAGKEEELRAQAAVESQARVDEILGRKPAAKPAPVVEPPVEEVAPPAPKPEPVAPPKPEPTAVAPAPESDLMSGDDALAWLQSLSAGKEEELRAQAAVESQARVDEILGRKPAAKPAPAVEPPVEQVTPPAPKPEPVAPPKPEPVPVAPAPESDLMSGDDALAWLQSLSAGKEEELRAQAAVESQARVDEILGRKPAAKPAPVAEPPVEQVTPPAPKPEPVVPPKPEPTPVAPAPESDLMSGDDALAWLQSLSAGKEEELRAQAAVESQARVDEILGRKPAAKPAPVAEPPVEQVTPPAPKPEPVAPPKPEPTPVAPAPESDLMSGDDALAWLQSLSAGKEEELRAQAAVESQARVDEILGRKPAAKVEPAPIVELPFEKVAPPAPKPEVAPKITPAPVVALPVEKVSPPVTPPPAPEPEPAPVAAPTAPKVTPPAMPAPQAELPAEPAPTEETPAPFGEATRHSKPLTPTTDLLTAMRGRLGKNPDDYDTRLQLARALWVADEVKESISHYTYLIQANEKTSLVVEDLRQYVTQRPKNALVLRTLGDAYMNEGLLEQALDIYNQAMNAL